MIHLGRNRPHTHTRAQNTKHATQEKSNSGTLIETDHQVSCNSYETEIHTSNIKITD